MCGLHTPLVPHTISGGSGGGDGGCDDDHDEATIDLRSGSQILIYKLKQENAEKHHSSRSN